MIPSYTCASRLESEPSGKVTPTVPVAPVGTTSNVSPLGRSENPADSPAMSRVVPPLVNAMVVNV